MEENDGSFTIHLKMNVLQTEAPPQRWQSFQTSSNGVQSLKHSKTRRGGSIRDKVFAFFCYGHHLEDPAPDHFPPLVRTALVPPHARDHQRHRPAGPRPLPSPRYCGTTWSHWSGSPSLSSSPAVQNENGVGPTPAARRGCGWKTGADPGPNELLFLASHR